MRGPDHGDARCVGRSRVYRVSQSYFRSHNFQNRGGCGEMNRRQFLTTMGVCAFAPPTIAGASNRRTEEGMSERCIANESDKRLEPCLCGSDKIAMREIRVVLEDGARLRIVAVCQGCGTKLVYRDHLGVDCEEIRVHSSGLPAGVARTNKEILALITK
jgi:hypothetical protein